MLDGTKHWEFFVDKASCSAGVAGSAAHDENLGAPWSSCCGLSN